MLAAGAGSSSLGVDPNTNTEQSPAKSSTVFLTSTNYSCTSCQASFENGQEQRAHMKAPWHVFNLKRRVERLPPIPLDEFEAQNGGNHDTKKVPSRNRSNSEEITENYDVEEEVSGNEDPEAASPFQCLFCNQGFTNDDDGFEMNLDHMNTAHGFSIPDPQVVEDIQSLVGYLATEVRVWHECLYCGATKHSTLSIQNHMRDKEHCLLNLDREPELLDFWENLESAEEEGSGTQEVEDVNTTNLSGTEMSLPSGRVIGSKNAAPGPAARKTPRKRELAVSIARAPPPGSGETETPPLEERPQLSSSRQLARRDEMSIAGLSIQQRQALVLAEKKAQRSEAVARRAREWVYAKGANSQKFDQLDNQMKWGKQNHKLLPR
ncbi:hypothetical protein TWF730_011185 [Orbilia blumenaviensis]|uniref:C2H2-type domain-containing protein n=1 Tax=Orbilia blumenaviensis TaxID=1796055 RepID=A0AAV9UNC8_9PEZI